MTPIFIGSRFGLVRLFRPRLGLFGGLNGLSDRLFLTRRFGRRHDLHGPREQAGENPTAQKRVTKKLPRLRPSGSAFGQGGEPANQVSGVFRIAEWIKEP